MTTRYRSKVDWWVGLILLAVPLIAAFSAVAVQLTHDLQESLVGWLVVVAVIGLYVVVVWPVEYRLEPERLVIRFGLMRSRIAYPAIREVRPSRSLLASPALSLDRLDIVTGTGYPAAISPDDRSAFLADLATRAPHLRRDGDRLVSS